MRRTGAKSDRDKKKTRAPDNQTARGQHGKRARKGQKEDGQKWAPGGRGQVIDIEVGACVGSR